MSALNLLSQRGYVSDGRVRCPWPECDGKHSAALLYVGARGVEHVRCIVCGRDGAATELYARFGLAPPETSRPALRVVEPEPEPEGKLAPVEVARIWSECEREQRSALAHLGELAQLACVRPTSLTDATTHAHARRGYVAAMLLSDVSGQPRGIQTHSRGWESSAIKGSRLTHAYLGEPGEIESAAVVCVAFGARDTLAATAWCGPSATVVGCATPAAAKHLVGDCDAAGVRLDGKLFVLLQHNDAPANKTRQAAQGLRALLTARGALCVTISPPGEFATVYDWRATSDDAWPPREVHAFFRASEPEPAKVPDGHALPMRSQYETDALGNTFTSLVSLIDDESTRLQVLGTREALSFDLMTKRYICGGRALVDADFSKVRVELEQFRRASDGKPLQFARQDIRDAIELVAARRQTHALGEYVSSRRWDGVARMADFAACLDVDADSIEAVFVRKWLLAAVARAIEPGCKAENVLLLAGRTQGQRKSDFFRAIGGKFYTASSVKPNNRDGLLVMRGYWIIEWSELEDIKGRSSSSVKSFLSRPDDTFRAPYGRDTVTDLRHALFGGTDNNEEPLEDETGDRRWWPIKIKRKIEYQWVANHRDQLIAEALEVYRAGLTCPTCTAFERCEAHRWYLSDAEEAMRDGHNKDFRAQSSVLDLLRDWTERNGITQTTLVTAQTEGLGLAVRDVALSSRRLRDETAAALRALGYVPGARRRDDSGRPLSLWSRASMD